MDFGPNNWYQRPRSTLGEVRCAPVDPSLPPPWEEVFDVATGRFYYWNTVTNVTQFEKPAYPNPFQSFYPFPYPEPVTSVPPSSASALFEPPHFSPPSLPTSHQTQPLALPIPVVHDLLNQIAAIQQTITDVSNTSVEALRRFQERRRRFQERRRQFQELRSQWPCRTTPPTVTSPAYSVHSNLNPSSTDVHNDVNLPFIHPHPTPQHHSSIPPAPHHTQTKSLHRKPLKGVRHRVPTAATRRVVKKTRKPSLLCGVAKYSRCKLNRIHGLWVVKATTSFFPEFDEEFCQLSMGPTAVTDTSPPTATNPSLPPTFNVSEKREIYLSVSLPEEASFTSPNCKRNDADVPNGPTHCVALAGASALDPELSNLNTAPTTLQVIFRADATTLENSYGTTTPQSPPQIGGAYSTSLRSVETPFSVVRAPLDCHSSSVVFVTGSLPFASLHSVVETNTIEKEPYGFSVVNLDWRLDKARELLVVLRLIHPKGEEIQSRVVSPWDFGIHLMKADFHGPIVLFGATDVEGNDEVLPELTSGVNIDPVVSALATVCAATFGLCLTIVQQVHMKAEFYEQEFANFSMQQMFTGTKPPDLILTPQFHLGVWELNLEVPINPCHNIEFVSQRDGGFQLHFAGFITDFNVGDFKKGKLGLSYCYRKLKTTANCEFLIVSGIPHILDYALKALLLEFERHLNFVIIMVANLASDYCYWQLSMPISVLFEHLEWSDVQVLGADELPNLLLPCLTASNFSFAGDTLLIHESLPGVPGSCHHVVAQQMGLYLPWHISIAIVKLFEVTALASTWPNQANSLVLLIGAASVKLNDTSNRLQDVAVPRHLSPGKHSQHSKLIVELILFLVPIIHCVCYDYSFARQMVVYIVNLELHCDRSTDKLAMALEVVEIKTKGTQTLHQLQPLHDMLTILVRTAAICGTWSIKLRLDYSDTPSGATFIIKLQVYSLMQDLKSPNHEPELDFFYITHLVHAISLFVSTLRLQEVSSGKLYLVEVLVRHFPCQHQHWRSIVDEVIAYVNNITELSFMSSLLVSILRDEDHCIIGVLLLNSIIQLVSLKLSTHGLAIRYGDIRNGNYCYPLSCLIHFPDFMTTWFIPFVCGMTVASVEFSVQMHGVGTLLFMWVHGSVIYILVYHVDSQMVGWHLVVKVFKTPKDNEFESWVAATPKWVIDALTTYETSLLAIDDLTVPTTQGRSRMFMQLRSQYFELLEFAHTPTNSSPSTSSLLQLLSQIQTHVVLPLHYMLILLLVLLDAYVDCRYPAKLGFAETRERSDIITVPQKVNDSVAESELQCLAETLTQYLLLSGYQMLAVLTKLTYVALFSSSDSSEEIPVGVHKCFRVLLLNFFACSANSWTYDDILETGLQSFFADINSIVANAKQIKALTVLKATDEEDNPSAGPVFFHLMCYNKREVKKSVSHSTSTASMKAIGQTVELLLQTFKLPSGDPGEQLSNFSSLRTSLFSRGEDLLGSTPDPRPIICY